MAGVIVNQNLLKLTWGKPEFAQITGVNRNLLKLQVAKFVQNQKILTKTKNIYKYKTGKGLSILLNP